MALLQAEKDIAVDELTLLCAKHSVPVDIPDSVSIDDPTPVLLSPASTLDAQYTPQEASPEPVAVESEETAAVIESEDLVPTVEPPVTPQEPEVEEAQPEPEPEPLLPSRTIECVQHTNIYCY